MTLFDTRSAHDGALFTLHHSTFAILFLPHPSLGVTATHGGLPPRSRIPSQRSSRHPRRMGHPEPDSGTCAATLESRFAQKWRKPPGAVRHAA